MDKYILLQLYCYLLFFLLLTINGIHSTFLCGDENFPPNTTYGETLDKSLLPSLASNVIREGGFYNASLDGVYTLSLCRKHYEVQACRSCVDRASRNLVTQCQGKTEAYHWDSEDTDNVSCLVRYSNVSTFGKLRLEPLKNVPHSDLPSDLNLDRFTLEFSSMANQTIEVASKADESSVLKYYGVSSAEFTDFSAVYMMMQCTPDLSSTDCNTCLRENVQFNQEKNRGRVGGTVSRPSCYFRWDLYDFAGAFDNLTKVPAPPRPPRSPEDSRTKKGSTIDNIELTSLAYIQLDCFWGLQEEFFNRGALWLSLFLRSLIFPCLLLSCLLITECGGGFMLKFIVSLVSRFLSKCLKNVERCFEGTKFYICREF